MSRASRAVLVLSFSSAGMFFVAGARTVTTLPGALWHALPSASAAAAAPVATAAELSSAPALVVPTSPDQWFAPGGRNEGTEALVASLAKLALTANRPLVITSGWGRTWGPDTSDHHASHTDSWAADLAVAGTSTPVAATDAAAQRIASALGYPGWAGGNLVTTYNGYRFQLLWRVSGHYDHVHIGVRKTGTE